MKIVVYTELPAELVETYQRFKGEAYTWKDTLSPQELAKHTDQYCSQNDRFATIVAFDDNSIVAGCKLFKRTITFKGETLHLGGIGGVWTRQDKQRQGIGTSVVKKALKELHHNNAEVIYICTDIKTLSSMYKPLGFIHLKQGHTYLGKSGTRYTEYDGMIAPGNTQKKFSRVLNEPTPLDIGRGNW